MVDRGVADAGDEGLGYGLEGCVGGGDEDAEPEGLGHHGAGRGWGRDVIRMRWESV